MADINEVVALNICKHLKRMKKKQGSLVSILKVPKQTVLRMLSGAQEISFPDLAKIASFCQVSVDTFFIEPDCYMRKAFMGRISSDKGKAQLAMADKLTDIYLFHNKYQTAEFERLINKSWNE